MKKAVILHGTGGSAESNWFRWLETELLNRGLEVWVPSLPGAAQPSLREYSTYVHENRPFELDDQTVIVGHSSGAILALILAQQSRRPVGGVVAVSVFDDKTQSVAVTWNPNSRLFDIPYDFDAIKRNTSRLLFIQSDDDPYVPVEQAKRVADSCAGEFILIPGQGHFNLEKSEEYREFPKLLELMAARNMV